MQGDAASPATTAIPKCASRPAPASSETPPRNHQCAQPGPTADQDRPEVCLPLPPSTPNRPAAALGAGFNTSIQANPATDSGRWDAEITVHPPPAPHHPSPAPEICQQAANKQHVQQLYLGSSDKHSALHHDPPRRPLPEPVPGSPRAPR